MRGMPRAERGAASEHLLKFFRRNRAWQAFSADFIYSAHNSLIAPSLAPCECPGCPLHNRRHSPGLARVVSETATILLSFSTACY
jgi:hypothetical protein